MKKGLFERGASSARLAALRELPAQQFPCEAPPEKWSKINVSFLADFPMKEREISHEETTLFG